MIFEYIYKKRYCNYNSLLQRYNEKIEKNFIISLCNWDKNKKYFLIKINSKKIKKFIKKGGIILSYYDKTFYKKIKQFKKSNFDNFIIVHNKPEEL